MRPSFPEYGILLAKTASLRSEDENTRVGAVAFDEKWGCLGCFYNGFLPKQKVDQEIWKDRDGKNKHVIHAENWLVSKTTAGQVYRVCLNISPCHKCSILLAAHGVREVYFEEEYHRETSFKDIFHFYGIYWRNLQEIKNHQERYEKLSS